MSNQGGWKPDKDSLVLAFFVEFIVYIVSAILVLVIGVVISIAAEDFTHLVTPIKQTATIIIENKTE